MNKDIVIKTLEKLADPNHPDYRVFEGDNDFKLRMLCFAMIELLSEKTQGWVYQIVRRSADNPEETPVLCNTFADKKKAEQWIEDHPSLSYVFKVNPCLVWDD